MRPELTLLLLDSVLTTPEPQCPFAQYPELVTIWDDPEFSQGAVIATRDWQLHDCKNPGGVWLIKHGEAVIGITGWFQSTADEAILRWTGILPSYRKRGLGRLALRILEDEMPPAIQYIVEISFSGNSQDWFLRNGYEYVVDAHQVERILTASLIEGDSVDLTTTDAGRVLYKSRGVR